MQLHFISIIHQFSVSLTITSAHPKVITGATDGIGREYARGLAKRRINVILISRTESKLLELCSEIKLKYGVKAKYIVADFTRGAPIYANIEKTLQEFPVGILGESHARNNFSNQDTISTCRSVQSTTWEWLSSTPTNCIACPSRSCGTL